MKPIHLLEVYSTVADGFAGTGNLSPTMRDIQSAVDELLEGLENDGCEVPHDYSPDRAFRIVRALVAGREVRA